jgi:hypothetical protein
VLPAVRGVVMISTQMENAITYMWGEQSAEVIIFTLSLRVRLQQRPYMWPQR